MKAWTDLKLISLPQCMEHLPTDPRGYPVPNFATYRNGKYDFTEVDPAAYGNAIVYKRCHITGLALGKEIAFVGGPISIGNRAFSDAGMLPDAARYAMQACPFIAAPKFAYAARTAPKAGGHLSPDRPKIFGLGVASSYRVESRGGQVIIFASEWVKPVEWWKDGVRVNPDTLEPL